ncbi:hypothetical protein FF100_16830 [Methylobacterium terricola]|uniref:Uncharacterized protein n=1 Tax=Methylobacterium terricola TaxID=2583531 RepID=A0A5C4LJQ8_9HYPH|nr:hypothetical protein [Methylobacterium terricola]TNC12474.1 hypothetical protein FF100_16830 [Methylobacterium terricola]
MSAALLGDRAVHAGTPPDDFAEDVDFEMTNLGRKHTNIPGIIFVSSRLGSHGPRVEWYADKPKGNAPCVIVSIGPDPVVRDDFIGTVQSRQAADSVRAWVRLNHAELLDFWNNGTEWDIDELTDFTRRLKPLP